MWENGVDVKQISIVLSWHDTCPMVKDDGGIGGYEEGAGELKKCQRFTKVESDDGDG